MKADYKHRIHTLTHALTHRRRKKKDVRKTNKKGYNEKTLFLSNKHNKACRL